MGVPIQVWRARIRSFSPNKQGPGNAKFGANGGHGRTLFRGGVHLGPFAYCLPVRCCWWQVASSQIQALPRHELFYQHPVTSHSSRLNADRLRNLQAMTRKPHHPLPAACSVNEQPRPIDHIMLTLPRINSPRLLQGGKLPGRPRVAQTRATPIHLSTIQLSVLQIHLPLVRFETFPHPTIRHHYRLYRPHYRKQT